MRPSPSQMAARAGATPAANGLPTCDRAWQDDRLTVSLKTVEKHRANLMSKLNAHDLAGLMRAAIKHGLILLDE